MNRGERVAWRYYQLRGYRLLDANVRAGRYELDLVVQRGRRLVFVEVKERAGEGFGGGLGAVGREKRRRVRHAARTWLGRHPEIGDVSVELVAAAVQGNNVDVRDFTWADDEQE